MGLSAPRRVAGTFCSTVQMSTEEGPRESQGREGLLLCSGKLLQADKEPHNHP